PTEVRSTATPIPLSEAGASGDQRALLIVGVADASASRPVLEGCWVLSYRPGIPQYYFSSFSPEYTFYLPSLGHSQSLAEIYALDLNQQLGFRFTRDAIESRFPGFKPQAEV